MQRVIDSVGPAKSSGSSSWMAVAPDFFKTMRIPVLAGRTISMEDIRDQKSNPLHTAAVVNEDFAHQYFGNENPLGAHFSAGEKSEIEIVGVVGNMRYENLRDASVPMVYVPIFGLPGFSGVGAFEIRTTLDPKALMPAVRVTVNRFDNNLLISKMKTQMERSTRTSIRSG